jgi:hypothetical protein
MGGMINPTEIRASSLSTAVASWENEGGAVRRRATKATDWFVPAIVVPTLPVRLVVARVAPCIFLIDIFDLADATANPFAVASISRSNHPVARR